MLWRYTTSTGLTVFTYLVALYLPWGLMVVLSLALTILLNLFSGR